MMPRFIYLAFCALLAVPSAHAITIYVTSSSGAHDVQGDCVLRDAVAYSNTGVPKGGCGSLPNAPAPKTGNYTNVIELPAGVMITLNEVDDVPSNTGLPAITVPLRINGNGSVIRRDPELACMLDGTVAASEFGLLRNNSVLSIVNLTLSNGCADGSSGGALYNSGQLSLYHVVFTNNHASFSGGAIASSGYGGANGTLTISSSTFADNSARDGGALHIGGTTASLYCDGSLFKSNVADQYFAGGALYVTSGVTAQIINSTFAQNSAGSGSAVEAAGLVALAFVTIANNVSVSGSGAALQADVNGSAVMQSLSIRGSLVADNQGGAGNCNFGTSNVADVASNMSSDSTCTGFPLVDVDAKLLPLADNGGLTLTFAPQGNSPAIDAAVGCTDTQNNALLYDQRGVMRPQGVACDIGAFEFVDSIFLGNFETMTQ